MSTSFSFNATDLRLGSYRITFNGSDLGGTMDGIKFKSDAKYVDLKIDQIGDAVVDSVLTGQSFSCETVLAASASKDLWKIAMPYGQIYTSGANKSFHVKNAIGTQMSQYANALVLHPMSKDDADLSEDFKFFKCYVKSAIEIEFGPSKQRGLKVEFVVIPDFSVSPARYMIIGDPSIGAIAGIAAAAVPGANVGNGTLTAQTPGVAAVTETITVTCIGTNGANHSAWKVVGSVSLAIGTVELVGGALGTGVFTSNKVNFTLTDGTTDFAVADSFTIATTAANYA